MKQRPSNDQIKQQALRANQAAEMNERLRKQVSSSFDDLELDQAQTPDRVDQSNWSWLERGSEQYHMGTYILSIVCYYQSSLLSRFHELFRRSCCR